MGKVFKGFDAKIFIGGIEIGCCSNVSVEIKDDLEAYYGIENTNPIFIDEVTEEITGSIKRVLVNIYYLRLMGMGETPFVWTNNISFDLILESSIEGGSPVLCLYNCRFKKVSISIPQNGFLEESYDFISIGIPFAKEIPMAYVEFDEPINWGYFKRQGEVWFWEPDLSHGGGYFYIQGIVWFWEPEGSNGGNYFTRA